MPRLYCRGCRLAGEEHIAFVRMPYSMKLLHQELAAMADEIMVLKDGRLIERRENRA